MYLKLHFVNMKIDLKKYGCQSKNLLNPTALSFSQGCEAFMSVSEIDYCSRLYSYSLYRLSVVTLALFLQVNVTGYICWEYTYLKGIILS